MRKSLGFEFYLLRRESPIRPKLHRLAIRSLKAAGRLGVKAIPKRLRENLDDRFFYAVFNLTRVTNDHYPIRETPQEESATGPSTPSR